MKMMKLINRPPAVTNMMEPSLREQLDRAQPRTTTLLWYGAQRFINSTTRSDSSIYGGFTPLDPDSSGWKAGYERRGSSNKNKRPVIRGGDLTGFTLLETVVAVILIVFALAGPFTLATRGIFAAKFAKNKLIALNLAQEGIEIIRTFRDNNFLTNQASWDAGIKDFYGQDTQADVFCPEPCTALAAQQAPNYHYQTCGASCPPLKTDPTTGLYSYGSGQDSIFTRTIRVETGVFDAQVPSGDQLKVISIVAWSESGIPHQVRLEEVLYRWQ